MAQPGRSHITMPTRSKPNAYTPLYSRPAAPPVVLSTVLANEIFLLQTIFKCLFSYYNICNNCVILHNLFYASSVALTILLLKKPSK